MDALKGVGHACGHNLIGISGETCTVFSGRLLTIALQAWQLQ